jgi:16S rRNA (cytidine1402-2'-O)-methyltransferase
MMMKPNRKELPGLWLVGTPIGNREDMTHRALGVLRRCDEVWCEDTRVTQRLLALFEISKRKERLDEASMKERLPVLIDRLLQGRMIAYCTDAGMPGVSDPGSRLVSSVAELGIPVHCAPGVSAVTTTLALSGISVSQFQFCGFFPRKTSEKRQALETMVQNAPTLFLWFESPKRIRRTIEWIAELQRENTAKERDSKAHGSFERDFFLPSDTQWVVAKELTKKFEEIWRGKPGFWAPEVCSFLDTQGEKGEWVLGASCAKNPSGLEVSEEVWSIALKCLKECGVNSKSAVQVVSHEFDVAKNKVYRKALQIFSEKN